MKVKTSELKDKGLDFMVAKCLGTLGHYVQPNERRGTTKWAVIPQTRRYSTNWAQGGPVIESEKISVFEAGKFWGARPLQDGIKPIRDSFGPTPLTAAMRCLVSSRMGEEVDLPEELLI